MSTVLNNRYASPWKQAAVVAAVLATMLGLFFAQHLKSATASTSTDYISVAEFAAGDTYATVLSTDGKAYSRGWNTYGGTGVEAGARVDVSDWTEIKAPEKLVHVSASDHTVAIGESGKLYSWGANPHGQIGNSTTTATFTPVQVTAIDRFSQIASGAGFTLALDNQGRLWSWGANNAGQLGDGTTFSHNSPIMVGGSATFASVYAAKETSYAIDKDGKLWAWGANGDGQIGDGTTNNRNRPAQVTTDTTWSKIAVSQASNTVLGIDTDGWLYSWGSNNNGLLGNGVDWRQQQADATKKFNDMIAQIKADDDNRKMDAINKCADDAFNSAMDDYNKQYQKVAAQRDAAMAAQASASAAASPSPSAAPTSAPTASAAPTPVPTASAAPSPSATASASPIPNPDDLKKPSRDSFLDDCTKKVESSFTPTDTSKMKAPVVTEPALTPETKTPQKVTNAYKVKDIAVGSENAYAVDVINRLYSWGRDENGQTGLGLEDPNSHTQVPVQVQDGVAQVTAGDRYAAALSTDGDVLLWGLNANGVLMSNPSNEVKLLKPTVKASGYTSVVAGLTTVYGSKGQTVMSWGSNNNGQLGSGSTDPASFSPVQIGMSLAQVAPGGSGAAALGTDNALIYWGKNTDGQFGNGKNPGDMQARATVNVTSTFSAVASADNYTLAVSTDGRLWGWGSNADHLIDPSSSVDDKVAPFIINTGTAKITSVAAGKNVNAFSDGSIVTVTERGSTPHTYPLAATTELAAGDNHVLARTKDGGVWGWSNDGKSGVRAGSQPRSFAKVDDRSYSSIAAGGTVSGALTDSGEAYLWGTGSDRLTAGSTDGSAATSFEFTKLSIGPGYVLGSDKNKVLWGWGSSSYGVLGTQSVQDHPTAITQANKEGN